LFVRGTIPLLASPQGGVAEGRGGFRIDRRKRENHPVCANKELRDIFLVAQPPLLAVMQGGELHTPHPRRLELYSLKSGLSAFKTISVTST
jgi:hypothetical protein